MPKTTEPTYNEEVLRLDVPYVQDCGEQIRARLYPRPKQVRNEYGDLVDGPTPYPVPAAITYQPKNGTRYDLIFTAVRSITQLGPNAVPSGSFEGDDEESAIPGHVVVTKANGTGDFVATFDLDMDRGPLVFPYVAEKTGLGFADAVAVTALLRAVAGLRILDR